MKIYDKVAESFSVNFYKYLFSGDNIKNSLIKQKKALKLFKKAIILLAVVHMVIFIHHPVLKMKNNFKCMKNIVLFVDVLKIKSYCICQIANKLLRKFFYLNFYLGY